MENLKTTKYFMLLSVRWIPRILCILFVIFISLFSLDVFGEETGFWRKMLAFLIHNIPTIILIVTLILSWKWPLTGGIGFTALGVTYLFRAYTDTIYPVIYLPLFAIGILYLLGWFLRNDIREADEAYKGDT